MENKSENEQINIEGEYWDAKQVVEDPQDYPDQTVIDAANFVRGYEYAIAIRPQAEISNSTIEDFADELIDGVRDNVPEDQIQDMIRKWLQHQEQVTKERI